MKESGSKETFLLGENLEGDIGELREDEKRRKEGEEDGQSVSEPERHRDG